MRIKGCVQGVGFRFFVRETAQKNSVTGWVQNMPDGDVEGEAQAADKALQGFLKHLERGHPWARVDHVAVTPMPDKTQETGFEIR